MRRISARYVVAVLGLAWVLVSLTAPRPTTGAFFSSPPSPLVKPMLYLPAVNRESRPILTRHLYLPVVTRW